MRATTCSSKALKYGSSKFGTAVLQYVIGIFSGLTVSQHAMKVSYIIYMPQHSVTFKAMLAGILISGWLLKPCRIGQEVEPKQRMIFSFLPVVGWAWVQPPLPTKLTD